MTLRRLGRDREARAVLKPIRADLDVIENRSYQRLLLMYKGELPVDSLLAADASGARTIDDPAIGYGVATGTSTTDGPQRRRACLRAWSPVRSGRRSAHRGRSGAEANA